MKKEEARTAELFDLTHSIAGGFLADCTYPWEALPRIRDFILKTGPELPEAEWDHPQEHVWIHKSVTFLNPATVTIQGPAIICAGAQIRPGAFIRTDVVIGERSVVGNSCEYKNCILFDDVETPHFNYIGDSILGWHAHTGCQALTSNVRSDKKPVRIAFEDGTVETGLRKFGAILGDRAEVGCSAVLNPGTILGKGAVVQPLSSVRRPVSARHIHKQSGTVAAMEER